MVKNEKSNMPMSLLGITSMCMPKNEVNPYAYIPSVTNFLADVTICWAATAAPFLVAATAAPFLGAHDPVGHFL